MNPKNNWVPPIASSNMQESAPIAMSEEGGPNRQVGLSLGNLPQLATPKEMAELLRVSPKTIYYWATRREIPFVRVGRHIRFVTHDVISHFFEKTRSADPSCHHWTREIKNRSSGSLKSGQATRLSNIAYSKKE